MKRKKKATPSRAGARAMVRARKNLEAYLESKSSEKNNHD